MQHKCFARVSKTWYSEKCGSPSHLIVHQGTTAGESTPLSCAGCRTSCAPGDVGTPIFKLHVLLTDDLQPHVSNGGDAGPGVTSSTAGHISMHARTAAATAARAHLGTFGSAWSVNRAGAISAGAALRQRRLSQHGLHALGAVCPLQVCRTV